MIRMSSMETSKNIINETEAKEEVEYISPEEAVEHLKKGNNCIWLIDYSNWNYGSEEQPSFDYPMEDPEELETMIFEELFIENPDQKITKTHSIQGW